MLSTSNQEMS